MTVADLIRHRAAALGRPLDDVSDEELGARLAAMPLDASDDLEASVAWLAGRGPEQPCERCGWREAAVAATDEPENEGALMFGDQVLGVLLCDVCLAASEADGPWDRVDRLGAAA